jgi:hypothetical protein
MKKRILVSIVIGLVLVLTGCGSAQSSTASATATTGLSMEGTLLVGTLKLESTSLAVSSTQASELLPLWETLQSMASSGTAASQEIDAVVSQIESSMSTEQVSSITAMNLTQQDLAAAMADTAPAGSANTTSTSAAQPQGDAGAPGAGVPPAGMGGGMPASSGAQSAGQAQASATQSVTGQTAGTSDQVSAALINTLVELLKKKIG